MFEPKNDVLPLPILATVKAAYGDVFGNIGKFARIAWLIFIMMVLFVEVPTLVVQEQVYKAIHPEKKTERVLVAPEKTEIQKPTETLSAESEKTDDKKPSDSADNKKAEQAVSMEDARKVPPESLLLMMTLNLLQMAMVFSFSVAWYRQLLFAEKKDHTIIFKFGKNEWQFALTCIKSGFVLAPIVFVMFSFILASLPGFAEGQPENPADNWPLFLGGTILTLYLMARLAMSYPLTVMGQIEEPIKQSWIMTQRHAGRVILGNLMIVVPVLLAALLIVVSASYLMNATGGQTTLDAMPDETRISFAENILYKAIGALFTLTVVALISAFYARIYAFLVRSKQADIKD